jgi:Rps23 Pro-64 3,4-dihydroxylase Tpa1-like proline 4-hydroxylase
MLAGLTQEQTFNSMRNSAFLRVAYCGCSLFVQCLGFSSKVSLYGAISNKLTGRTPFNTFLKIHVKRLVHSPIHEQEIKIKVPLPSVDKPKEYQYIIPQHKLERFRSGDIPIIFISSLFPSEVIDQIRNDAKALELFGGGVQTAGVAKGFGLGQSVRKDVHQFWLSSPGQVLSVDSIAYVGDTSIRHKLFDTVEQIRKELVYGSNNSDGTAWIFLSESERKQKYYDSLWGFENAQISIAVDEQSSGLVQGIDTLHPSHIELSYLSYCKGSFYRRHLDRIKNKGDKNRDSNRIVSFILYLGSDDDGNRDWDPNRDGGCLRVYGKENVECLKQQGVKHSSKNDDGIDLDQKIGEEYIDISPSPGTFVVFDSSKVAHAVRETHRSRRCVVGWLGSPT